MNYIVWCLVALLYSPIIVQLYNTRWKIIDYTHAYFILPVALVLSWLKRKEIKAAISRPGLKRPLWPIALFLIGLLMFVFGWKQDYLLVSSLSAIPLLFGLTGYLYGTKVSRSLSFPILYLLLLVPPPLGILDNITLPMRHWVSIATESILKTFSYPITRDGLMLSIGGHDIYMGAPCSGFRSLITMLALGLIYAYLSKSPIKNKIILVTSIIPLALIGNLLRVTGVCLATYHFGESFGHKFHDISGYVVFLLLILSMMALENLLDKLDKPNPGL